MSLGQAVIAQLRYTISRRKVTLLQWAKNQYWRHFIKLYVFLTQYEEGTIFSYFFFPFKLLKILNTAILTATKRQFFTTLSKPGNLNSISVGQFPATEKMVLWQCGHLMLESHWRLSCPVHASMNRSPGHQARALGMGACQCSQGNLLKDWSYADSLETTSQFWPMPQTRGIP